MTPSPAAVSPVLPEAERLAALRLIRSENVGPVTYMRLIARFGTPTAALAALPDLAARGGARRQVAIAPLASVEAEIAAAQRMGARFVIRGEADYPAMLLRTDAAPPVLAVMGETAQFERPAVAIVGARSATAAGGKLARLFADGLGREGYAIVSGLARGIDTAAHEASLGTGTVGVFAGGLDRPYPPENRPLMRRIVDGGGCLVTEMPFGWEPRAVDFPRRNRVVVALSLAVLVVEAAMRSGTLISARLAGELGRLLFAVPGSPLDAKSAGCNALIKDGAMLVTDPTDILDALAPLDDRSVARHGLFAESAPDDRFDEPGDDERSRLVRALSTTPVSLDDLVAHAEVEWSAAQVVLLELDLAGRLERHSGGRLSLLP
ncbi:DNA-processing protein DprA [Aureimonas sp. Leaf324]|uniref:DNA-processing protein DprA n=1 Tax=Aureimonas sp. Leaf324 TaxID=1736336 RepID=UPI00070235FA|nr:DNA-processing protein DprA [Aureimonas sp. Leaf324]KQQ91453.1 DNA processing protein DprA [Aureimonas sp. Leaf324]